MAGLNDSVAVILLNYNGYEDTLECVNSLKRNLASNCRIVVVDNCSTDNKTTKLVNYCDNNGVIYLSAPCNNGFSAGNNIGIKYAIENKFQYILLLNNDTVCESDIISPLISILKKDNSIGCISTRINYFHDKDLIWYNGGVFNRIICRAKHIDLNSYDQSLSGINDVNFISGCFMLIPISVIKEIGYMDESYFLYVEDTEYSLRIKNSGYRLLCDSDLCIYHKVSASTKRISNAAQYYEIRNRYLLAKKYLSKFERIRMVFYDCVFYSYKIITKQYLFSVVVEAINDYMHKCIGKRNG